MERRTGCRCLVLRTRHLHPAFEIEIIISALTERNECVILKMRRSRAHKVKGDFIMPVTSGKIAELAGVSRGTVDRALHNRGGVKPEVEKKIKQIAKELGYEPDRAGKALSSRKNPPKIGVLLNSLGNAFFDEVKEGIAAAEKELADFRLKILLKEVKGYQPEDQLAALDEFASLGVKGIVIMPVNDLRVADKINELSDRGIRFVTVNTDIDATDRIAYVGSDYIKGGQTAAGLAELILPGKTELLIVTGSIKNVGHNKRIYGFGRAMKDRLKDIRVVDIVENQDDEEQAYRITAQKLREYPEVNLIYAVSAGVGGVVRAVSEHSGQIRILCFDSTPQIVSLIKAGKITATICQEPYEQGYRSVRILFDAIVNGILPASEYQYTACQIKIRQNIE